MSEAAYKRFIASMNITYEQWHDGIGYDLEALAACDPDLKFRAEHILLTRGVKDWRDLEALQTLATPKAMAAIRATLKSSDPELRLRAAQMLEHEEGGADERESAIVHGLETGKFYGGLTQAFMAAEETPTPAVKDALFRLAAKGGEGSVHAAALLFFLHGLAKSSFDWDQRPFFLRFNAPAGTPERRAVFEELCKKCKVDAAKYI